MSKSLLLISSRPDDKSFAEVCSRVTTLPLIIVTDAKEGARLIQDEQIFAILADTSTQAQYQALETAIQESVGLFSDKVNANAFHFISSERLEDVEYLIKSPIFGHYIQRNFTNAEEAGEHYGHILKGTMVERAFGLKGLLKEGAKIQTVKLSLSTQKQEAVEAVKNYLIAAKFQSRMATVIANAVDELIMNAIFDAPVDALGKQVLASTTRNTSIKLEGQNAVELQVGYDGAYVAISTTDLFGSLDKNKLLSHISKIYTDEEYKVKTAVAGAGIGLATVFRSGGSFFFVSESRVRTEVTVFFRRTDSFREFKDQFKFLSTQFYF